MKVLITTSGTGSRLGDLTNYTNKSLVRIGKKPAISYIIEQYDEDIEFVITIGHKGNLVVEFLEMTYPNRKFTFVEVDKYEGEGSSLAYSISKAEKELQCPFIYQACDTIVLDKKDKLDNNWCGVYRKDHVDNSLYRTIKINGSNVCSINNKGDINFDFIYIGVSFIKDYNLFWESMKLVLNENSGDSSDCDVINKMIKRNNFKYQIYDKWLDIGNTQSLTKAREEIYDSFQLLDKIDESLYIFDEFVIKFFNDEKIIKNRVERAKILGDLVPKILDVKNNFYKYEYVKGDLLSENINNIKIEKFLIWLKNNLWKTIENNDDFYDICKNFYIDKTHKRLQQLFKILNITDQEDIINGIKIPPIKDLLSLIDIDWLCNVKPYNFHGDLILDNVIFNGDFKLLDWRQDFGGDIKRGDIYYDLAKLNHNFILNHHLINKKYYNLDIDENGIRCDILRSNMLCECQDIFYEFVKNNRFDLAKIKLLTSIIWLNMSPLHDYPLNKFLYYFGKYNLYKNIKIM